MNDESGTSFSSGPDLLLLPGFLVYNAETGEHYRAVRTLEEACLLLHDISRHGSFNVGIASTIIEEVPLPHMTHT